ncbi:hypothetical protein Ahy_B05g076090 [Arachis hypogaea]|uniref:Transposase, Ptta/En/Spm, plant n=1 Tax=Arachis hypogaea TaxID=3818 RepID=A0A444Z2M3_ARAHY|nr:hypothetical protein Ahy_B05g076090 [Arachis hypogaea]
MARKGRYMKKAKLGPGCQQPHTAPSPASAAHRDDSEILPDSGDSVPATARPFLPPRSVPRPAPQTSTTNIQNSELGHVNLAANTNDVDSLDQEDNDPIVDPSAQNSDGTVKPARLSVREAMERPNGRRIVLRFNSAKQAIGDEAGLLNGVLGLLGSEYGKFSICEKSWRKIITKDKVYNECIKQIFHFDEDNERTIKKYILKSMGKSWKEARLRLYNTFYETTFSTEENIEQRLPEIDREHWRWFLNYRAKAKTKVIYRKNKGEESVEESYGSKCTKKKDGSYINDEARLIGKELRRLSNRMSLLECCLKMIPLLRFLEKRNLVEYVGVGLTPSQLFSPNSRAPVNGVQVEETQRKLLELQAELEREKLKRKAMESALIYLYQR